MAEYIEREAARIAYEKSREANKHNINVARAIHAQEHRHILHVLDKIPAADVEPVRHGRCEYCKDGKSFIGAELILGNDGRFHKINHCPHCGCKMDGGAENGTE